MREIGDALLLVLRSLFLENDPSIPKIATDVALAVQRPLLGVGQAVRK